MLAMWLAGLTSDPDAMSVAVPTSIIVPGIVAPAVTLSVVALVGRLEQMNAHLTALARTDPLTGAANRRGFFEMAEQLFESEQDRANLLVGMVDIDEFKQLNDTLGHDRGDRALRELASLIDAALGDRGIVGRLGGDEFAFVVRGVPSETATLRAQIFGSCGTFTIDGHVTVSASIGISEARSDDSVDLALSRADAQLYRTKRERQSPLTTASER